MRACLFRDFIGSDRPQGGFVWSDFRFIQAELGNLIDDSITPLGTA